MEHGTFFAALLPGEESTCPHYTQERASIVAGVLYGLL